MDKGTDDFNKHDLAAMDSGMADDAVESDQSSPADVTGKAKIAEGTKMFLSAFPDGKAEKKFGFTAGDYGVMVSTFTGTNNGDMGPMKKTGKVATLTVAEINQFEGGKVKHVWRFFNSAAMAMQLGMGAGGDAPKDGAAPKHE
jgi:predicted ester cyclase